MPTIKELTERPSSGFNHIDALIDSARPWNFIGRDTIRFSFGLVDGHGLDPALLDQNSVTAFNPVQQAQARAVMAYAGQVTGIRFAESADASAADVHFANANLRNGYTSQTMSSLSYSAQGGQATDVRVHGWILLDAFDDVFDNLAPLPGGIGYESLLHELGHVLGLKHPSEGADRLPVGHAAGQDNPATTLMSTTDGTPQALYAPYDLAALQWLYGGDGLGGAYGVGAPGKALVGSAAADSLYGSQAADRLTGGAGDDLIDGGAGIDIAVLRGSGFATVTRLQGAAVIATGPDGSDTLMNVERLQFDDGWRAFDSQGAGGQAFRLYQAAFDRQPDAGGLGWWIRTLDQGVRLVDVSQHFIDSPEFAIRYGSLDTTGFVTQLYANVLHRAPDGGGLAYWVANLSGSAIDRAGVLMYFSESDENQAALIGVIQDGMSYA
jgi:serralysin